MSALDWLRGKADAKPVRFLTVSEADAGEATIAGTWKVTGWHFKGRLPSRMVFQLREENQNGKLQKTFDGKRQVEETLRLGGQYRSEFNNCEFWRTEYELIETGTVLA